ncbi:type IV pili methyl-accepting chemotaxis transducer N-terminal domain-containing protein [Candidatus Binatia bacterium]|nr:type IV pili methyl-accepting chemotaxis transducer N-terminal domain-containing protein [Candidatus Binatia bacterium]
MASVTALHREEFVEEATQDVSAALLDIAGRQRMLNQRLLAETLAAATGAAVNREQTRDLLRVTAVALANGGEAILVPGASPVTVILPPPPNHEIRARLAAQRELAAEVDAAAERVSTTPPGSKGFASVVAELLSAGQRFHAVADDGVRVLSAHIQQEKADADARERAMTERLQHLMEEVTVLASSLGDSSNNLAALSQQLRDNAELTAERVAVVSSSAEQASSNLQTVAAGAEEMTASIKEITQNTVDAAKVSANAVEVARVASQSISGLGQSSTEIGEIVKLITSVAQQTNLLALNATIEAARAGEAGKGFAVVANEVKELAKETARASADISRKVEAIQGETKTAIEMIGQISSVIQQVSDISNTIAGAVEEQSATTNEMSRNVNDASRATHAIAESINDVAQTAQQTKDGAETSHAAAVAMADLSGQLRKLVTRQG